MRFATIEDIDRIIAEKNLAIVNDESVIKEKIDEVFKANEKAVKDKAIGFLVGKTLKLVTAEASLVKKLVEKKFGAVV